MGRPITLLHVGTSGLAVVLSEEESVYSVQSTDLLPLPRTLELWINIYEEGCGAAHRTERDANINASEDRLVCKRVVVEH